MTEAHLYVHRSAEGKLTVQLTAQPSDDLPDPSTYYRVSPIFRVWPDLAGEVDFSGEVVFAFYILDNAYRVISEISARLPRVRPFLWFSHGLASVIVISPEPSLISEVDMLVTNHQIASEKWKVTDGLIGQPELSFPPDPPAVDLPDFAVADYSSLPEDVCTIVREFNHSLNKAVWLSRLFMPRELSTYRLLLQAVNDIIATLVQYHVDASGTSDAAGETIQTGNEDHLARRKAIHQLQDRLVQINSALSYLMSQAFAGVVPIMQRECLIRNYSLLGVGTAVAGISALARRVELVFENTPIDLVIEREFRGRSKLEGWLTPGNYDVRSWDQPQFGVDEYLNRVPNPPHIPKLIYLSGRLGFREAEFSVSSALQVLSAADSVGWSLMTLTHELLHGHVRELMSAILIRPSESSNINDFHALVADYHREKHNRSEREIDRFDSLRFIILHYCEQVTTFGSLSFSSQFRPTRDGKLRAPMLDLDAETLREILELEYRNISEIMVHVLDFFYFYNAEPANYLPFVWESWSKVPSVLKNIQHYLLRSVVTIATKLDGTRHERFTAAVAIVHEQITIAAKRNPANEVLREAIDVLENADKVAEMRLPFYPSLLIGDLTAKILRARSLHVALLGDDLNLDAGPTSFRYAIRSGTFVDDQVISPTAFLLGVLDEALSVPKLAGSQRESAWVYLALASSTSLRGGGPDVR